MLYRNISKHVIYPIVSKPQSIMITSYSKYELCTQITLLNQFRKSRFFPHSYSKVFILFQCTTFIAYCSFFHYCSNILFSVEIFTVERLRLRLQTCLGLNLAQFQAYFLFHTSSNTATKRVWNMRLIHDIKQTFLNWYVIHSL